MIIETPSYKYSCSKCNYEWFSVDRPKVPQCPRCHGSKTLDEEVLENIREKLKDIPGEEYCKLIELSQKVQSFPMMPDVCFACSNHPKNGGSGVCHCILGSQDTWR
jgi:DNA-directed RNA polymerase subunit RPC12/RpoP